MVAEPGDAEGMGMCACREGMLLLVSGRDGGGEEHVLSLRR